MDDRVVLSLLDRISGRLVDQSARCIERRRGSLVGQEVFSERRIGLGGWVQLGRENLCQLPFYGVAAFLLR